jgi:hypothetical protein
MRLAPAPGKCGAGAVGQKPVSGHPTSTTKPSHVMYVTNFGPDRRRPRATLRCRRSQTGPVATSRQLARAHSNVACRAPRRPLLGPGLPIGLPENCVTGLGASVATRHHTPGKALRQYRMVEFHCPLPGDLRCLTTKSHQFNSTDRARSATVSWSCRRSTPSPGRRGPWVSVCGFAAGAVG